MNLAGFTATAWMFPAGALVLAMAGAATAAPADEGNSGAQPASMVARQTASTDTVSVDAVSVKVIEQPRSFGYTLGDILTQRVLLPSEGETFEPAGTPRYERVGVWFERRAPRLETDTAGRRWLAVDYQIITSPPSLMTITVPAWTIADRTGTRRLAIDGWKISVSPLTPAQIFAGNGFQALRPDQPAPTIPTQPMQRRLTVWTSALALTLALWMGWTLWRNWRAAISQPFARALRDIRQLDETSPDAWRALHRAFDRTAGLAAQPATLGQLFVNAPQLLPMRPEIERFFAQSTELFFGQGLPVHPVSVRKLCTALRRIEKRVEK